MARIDQDITRELMARHRDWKPDEPNDFGFHHGASIDQVFSAYYNLKHFKLFPVEGGGLDQPANLMADVHRLAALYEYRRWELKREMGLDDDAPPAGGGYGKVTRHGTRPP